MIGLNLMFQSRSAIMLKFLLQRLMYLYCSDQMFHLICKNLYEYATYEEGEITSMGSATACTKKSWKLVILFNKSSQEMSKLKLSQQLCPTAEINYTSHSIINFILQEIVTRCWSTRRVT